MRDSRAGYIQSLEVLKAANECGVFTKSSLMLGLGEQDDEVIDAMLDLRDAGQIPFFLFLSVLHVTGCPAVIIMVSKCGIAFGLKRLLLNTLQAANV